MSKLLLLDGMALVYRAYYALNRTPRLNSKGLNTSAVLGFTTTLFDLIRQQQPSHIAVAFDVQAPTFRHELFPDYKANRDAMPEEIQTALPYIFRIIDAFNIPILTAPGYEADDVIGTVAHKAQAAGIDQVLMVTPDKDFAQLVTDHVFVYRLSHHGRPDQLMGIAEVCEKFGVTRCSQVIDLLGLWGDASDNIPGIRGVGEKTAKKLIVQFGSIENMIEHADMIGNERIRKIIVDAAQQALFSKKLATIVIDAPVAFDEAALRLQQPDFDKLFPIFGELEFRNLSKRIASYFSHTVAEPAAITTLVQTVFEEEPDLEQPTLFAPPVTDESLNDTKKANTLQQLSASPCPFSIYFDGATVAVAADADSVYVGQVGDVDLEMLKKWVEDAATLKLCFDLKQVKYLLRELGMTLRGEVFDVQLVHYLIDAEARHTFTAICTAVLGFEPQTPEQCAAALWQLYPRLSSSLGDTHLQRLYYEVERPLVDVLIAMEEEGVCIDVEALKSYSKQLTQQRDQLEQDIYALSGTTFNIGSPKQLGEVLFDKLKVVEKPPLTASKQYSTAEDVLLKIKDTHPVVAKVLQHRSLNKLLNTYINTFPQLISPVSGRLHTVYNQTVTATGRLSSSHPNLQNIPVRSEQGREIRRAFVARDDQYLILAADYSQIELRLIAALSADEHLCEAFRNHLDIHAATAAKIFHVPIEQVSTEQRRNAKSVNFGIVYGISPFGLSQQLGISRKDAAALIDEYFAQYPSIKAFIAKSIEDAHRKGYAETLLGRRRYLYDINSRNNSARAFSERNAVNMPIQGTSADMIKIAMNRIYGAFEHQHLKSKMILQVHDELVFDVFRPELECVTDIVRREMTQALPLEPIPVEVSIDTGSNWLDAH